MHIGYWAHGTCDSNVEYLLRQKETLMLFMISPAKKMIDAGDAFAWRDMPRFLSRTHELLDALRSLSYDEAKALWKCSDALAELNYERVARMRIDAGSACTPAVFSYEGIQYQNMAPQVMTEAQLDYLQDRLRILSGFYGVLRPFDAVMPYRLEMQAKLAVGGARDLYGFWGSRLFDALAADAARQAKASEPVIVNLASVEYAKAVLPHAKAAARAGSPVRVATCLFGTVREGRLVQRSTEAKAARGTFVRWCAENAVEHMADLVRFDVGGYAFDQALSTDDTFVFARR